MMKVTGESHGAFRITAEVPEDMISLPVDGDWAAWLGLASAPAGERLAVVLVAITVTAFNQPPASAPGEALAAMLRARNPGPATLIEEFTTPAGHPAAGLRRAATQRVNERDVTTGQAQVYVAYTDPQALGVISGLCLHSDDLDTAAALVADIASRLTVTAAAAAA